MANALFNYITPYFAKISTQNHINDLKFIMRKFKRSEAMRMIIYISI